MLNSVPKFAQCEERTNKFQTGFQSRKPKQKISKFQNFPKNISREPCKEDVCPESMSSEKKKYVESCSEFSTLWDEVKICLHQNKFSKSKPKTKLLKFQNFPKKTPKEHCKNYMYQVPIESENEVKNCPSNSGQVFKLENLNKIFEIPEFWTELYKQS